MSDGAGTRVATPADVIEGGARYAILVGDCRDSLRALPDGCVQTCVTSPPYLGLRDYGTAVWVGGDDACDHQRDRSVGVASSTLTGSKKTTNHQQEASFRRECGKCGALRIDSQIGQEASPQEFVDALVEVFAEVRRVLADDGVLWLNLGDSYAANRTYQVASTKGGPKHSPAQGASGGMKVPEGLKAKDLIGVPWAVAFALRDAGWWLRCDIIWQKLNSMPESVVDRPTRSHEYVFLLSKSDRYFYNSAAIREPVAESTARDARIGTERLRDYVSAAADFGEGTSASRRNATNAVGNKVERNARSVWPLVGEPYDGAHFATMPQELARRCILAGSRRGDIVLDPFAGASTTALVALGNGRRAIGCELNPEYARMGLERVATVDTSVAEPVRVVAPEWGALFAAK